MWLDLFPNNANEAKNAVAELEALHNKGYRVLVCDANHPGYAEPFEARNADAEAYFQFLIDEGCCPYWSDIESELVNAKAEAMKYEYAERVKARERAELRRKYIRTATSGLLPGLVCE